MAINKQQALEIARRTLHDVFGRDMVLLEDNIAERDFGWAFMSTSQAFLQTRDPSKAVPGVGPLVVNKADGSTEFLSTSVSPEAGIDLYEQQWRDQQNAG